MLPFVLCQMIAPSFQDRFADPQMMVVNLPFSWIAPFVLGVLFVDLASVVVLNHLFSYEVRRGQYLGEQVYPASGVKKQIYQVSSEKR